MELTDYRNQIDAIDAALVDLFCQRMEVAAKIAAFKQANGLPISMPAREREKLDSVMALSGSEIAPYTRELYTQILHLSRSYQSELFKNAPL